MDEYEYEVNCGTCMTNTRLTVYDIDEMPVFCCMCGEQARIINLNYE
jgi:ribosomal protein S27E|tara:strand:- start:5226 stop:5366 length:141 start_codon:yes stop_codon:yes gene_type:complete